MATTITATSRFTYVYFTWSSNGYINAISAQVSGDSDRHKLYLTHVRDYEDVSDASILGLLRENYEENDGLLDVDGNKLSLIINNFSLSDGDTTIEDLTYYGSFNPLVPAEFEGWLENLEVTGAFIREGQFVRDGDTERPGITYAI